MDDTRRQVVRIEIDSSQAETSAKRINASQDQIGTTATRVSTQGSSAMDKMAASALRNADANQKLAASFVQIESAAQRAANVTAQNARIAAARSNISSFGDALALPVNLSGQDLDRIRALDKAQQDARRGRGGTTSPPPPPPIPPGPDLDEEEKKLKEIERAHENVTKLIRQGQLAQLSGNEKLEAQRQNALASFGKTDNLIRQINGHFDDLIKNATAKNFADKVKQFIQNPMGAAAEAAESFVTKFGFVGVALASSAVILTLGAAAAANLAAETGKTAEQFQNMAARTGLSVTEVQEFTGVAEVAGINAGAFTTSMRTLSKAFSENSDEGAKAKNTLRQLGIDGGSAIAGVRPLGEILPDIFKKLENVREGFERDRILIQLFGRAGLEFAPLIGHLDELMEAVKRSGVVMDAEGIRKAAEYDDQLDKLGLRWKAVKQELAQPIIGVISFVVDKLSSDKDQVANLAPDRLQADRLKRLFVDPQSQKLGKAAGQAFLDQQKDIDRANEALIAGIEKSAGVHESELKKLKTELKSMDSDIEAAENRLKAARLSGVTGSPDRDKAIADLKQLNNGKAAKEKEIELADLQAQSGRRQATAALQAQRAVASAQAAELGGAARILVERDKLIDSLTTEIGKRGDVIRLSLNQSTLDKINAEAQIRIASEQRKEQQEVRKLVEANLDLQTAGAKAAAQQDFQEASRALDITAAREESSRVDVEARRLQLHKQELADELALDLNQIERRKRQEQAAAQETFERNSKGLTGDALKNQTRLLLDNQQAAQKRADEQTAAARAAAAASAKDLDGAAEQQRIEIAKNAEEQRRRLGNETISLQIEGQKRALSDQKQAALDNLDLVAAKDITGRRNLTQQRLAIELAYTAQEQAIDQQAIAQHRAEAVKAATDEANQRKETAEDTARDIAAVNKRYDQEVINASAAAYNSANEARRKASIEIQRQQIESDRQVFDSIKQGAGNLIDEIFNRSSQKSFGQILADNIKNALKSAFKDLTSSQIAKDLTSVITGDKVALQQGRGPLGKLGIGAVPTFDLSRLKIERAGGVADVKLDSDGNLPVVIMNAGPAQNTEPGAVAGARNGGGGLARNVVQLFSFGGGASSAQREAVTSSIKFDGFPGGSEGATSLGSSGGGGSSAISKLISLFGGGGSSSSSSAATPPFLPGSSSAGGGGILGKLGLGGAAGNFQGLLGQFGFGSGVGGTYGSGVIGTGLSGGLKAFGGSNAGALLGAGLAFDGLRRGGITGLAETTGGGALLGYKFGGPIGAAIGAGVGALAGIIRLGIKGDLEQMQKKVKDQYGITISQPMAQQLVQLAKQNFNGQFDLALQSPDAQRLLELYARSTGQPFGLANKARPAYLASTGGKTYQALGNYENGSSIGFQSSLATLGSFDKIIGPTQFTKTGTSAIQQPLSVSVSLDGKSSAAFLQGQTVSAIQASPRTVADATQDAYSGSYNRLQTLATLTQPGTVLA